MINRFVLGGNLTRDAELRSVNDGTSVLGFRIGHTPYKKDAFFVDVSVWGRRAASLAEHLTKGTAVIVDGQLSQRQYEHNGETRISLELRADDVQFASSKASTSASTSDGASSSSGTPQSSGDDDPFGF